MQSICAGFSRRFRLKVISVLVFGLCLTSVMAEARPRYGCRYWPLIVQGIEQYKVAYKQKRDSIVNPRYDRSWFEDPVLNMTHQNYIVDSLGFFGSDCDTTINSLSYSFLPDELKRIQSGSNVLYLSAVTVSRLGFFIIRLHHPKSDWNVYFEFTVNADELPRLVSVYRIPPDIE